jgi:hypothetical protein
VKAALPRLGFQRTFEVSHIDPTALTDNIRDFLSHFQALTLDTGEQKEHGFAVQEIELSLGVSAKGGIALNGKKQRRKRPRMPSQRGLSEDNGLCLGIKKLAQKSHSA